MSECCCPRIPLPTSTTTIPALGMGTYDGGNSSPHARGTVAAFVQRAVECYGVRLVDCAFSYLNEDEVGDGLLAAMQGERKVPREELFVVSKLANPYHRREHVRPALQKSLQDLNLAYVDLYLMHWPLAFKHVPFNAASRGHPKGFEPHGIATTGATPAHPFLSDPRHDRVSIRETWEAMEELVDAGLAKNIGVANFTPGLLHDLLTYARIRPAVLQIEVHPYCAQKSFVAYAKKVNIQVMAYAPLGYGQFKLANERTLLQDPELSKVAAEVGRTPAQVVLRWHHQRGVIPIPKTLVEAELQQNTKIFEFSLSESQMARIDALDCNYHFVRPSDPGWYEVPLW